MPPPNEVDILNSSPSAKSAVTVLFVLMVTVHGCVLPVQAPLQPVNEDPELAVAVIDTTVPSSKTVPVGVLNTAPFPAPVLLIVRVN